MLLKWCSCIFSADNFQKAFQALANFLLFSPEDEQMLKNKDYYINSLGYSADSFVPSKVGLVTNIIYNQT